MKPSFHGSSDPGIHQGVVYKKTIGNYSVWSGERTVVCALSSQMRKPEGRSAGGQSQDHNHRRDGRRAQPIRAHEHTDPVTVGDQVRFVEAQEGMGTILEVLPRRNKLARQTAVPMPSARPFEQVIAANVDQVVPVFAAANPAPRWNLLDRYLVSAESAGLPSLICITKLDLAKSEDRGMDEELRAEVNEYRKTGYPLILASAVTGEGIDELKEALRGRLSVFLGQSGVGKSSLLNAIQPGLGLRVNEVSRVSGKGKHTTTHLEMFPLETGGAVVDTPGVREFGLWDVEEYDLALFFPEMRPLVGRCKFGLDCEHDEEPGCAIRKAVTAGKISPRRYQSYLKLKATV